MQPKTPPVLEIELVRVRFDALCRLRLPGQSELDPENWTRR
jgi:hypothetical protein